MGLAPFLNRAILAIAVGLTNALFDYHIAVEFKIITPILIMGLKKYYFHFEMGQNSALHSFLVI